MPFASVTMPTRAPPAIKVEQSPDIARIYDGITEPFTVTIRQLDGGSQVKIICWYIGAVEEEMKGESVAPEEKFRIGWFGWEEALEKPTYSLDRDVVRTAIGIVATTIFKGRGPQFGEGCEPVVSRIDDTAIM